MDPKPNLQGQRFEKPKGPASLILLPLRDWIWTTLNCFWNPAIKTKLLAPDGTQTIFKDAEIIMGPLGWVATLDLTSVVGGAAATVGGVNYQTTNYTAVSGDNGKLISFNSGSALTLTLPAAPPSATWFIAVECVGAGGLTISRNSLNIDTAAADVAITQNQGLLVYTDGTNYFTMRGVGGSSGGAQMFVIKTLSNADYVVANTWDGTTRGSTDIKIAKSPRLRPSVTAETIDGVSITYSAYTSDNTRTASDGTNTEYQVAFPRYVALASGSPASNQETSIIFAVPAATGLVVSSVAVSWVEVSPARVWARRYVQ